MNKIFEPKASIKVKDLAELNIEALLSDTFTTTEITVTGGGDASLAKKGVGAGASDPSVAAAAAAGVQKYTLIPKAVLSLKVLQELPMIVVLMYHLYKQVRRNQVSMILFSKADNIREQGPLCINAMWAWQKRSISNC